MIVADLDGDVRKGGSCREKQRRSESEETQDDSSCWNETREQA